MLPFMNVCLFPDEYEKPYRAMSASWANNVIPQVIVEAIVALLAPVLKSWNQASKEQVNAGWLAFYVGFPGASLFGIEM
nr:hypothetical protein [Tanacetum cinerariifolium]